MFKYFRDERDQLRWDRPGTLIRANPLWIRAQPALWRQARRELPQIGASDFNLPQDLIWLATSGSSSDNPTHMRWVALSRDASLASATAVNEHLDSTRQDLWLHALPLFHVGGLGILARAYLSGARIQAGIAGSRWDPRYFHQVASSTQATLTALVPTQLYDVVQLSLHAPASLRAVIIGGAATHPDLLRQAQQLGWRCLPSYGMTETGSQVATAPLDISATAPPEPRYPRTTDANDFPTLRILKHARLRSDESDQLWISGTSLLSAYAEFKPQLVLWDPRQDGWLASGDLGRVIGDEVQVWGRCRDLVKVLGEKVYLEAIESKLAALGVLRASAADWAVIAQPHPRRGAELILCVEGSVDAPEPLLNAINQSLLPFERIQRLCFVTHIPRTALGKPQRILLQNIA